MKKPSPDFPKSPLGFRTSSDDPSLHRAVSEKRASAVGAILQNQRTKKGETLETVAEKLRIRHAYIEALEKGDFKSLPGLAYASGFLRSYAEYLHLDSAALVNQFRDEMAVAARQVELTPLLPDPENHIPNPLILSVALVFFLAIYGVWAFLSHTHKISSATASLNTSSPPPTPASLPDILSNNALPETTAVPAASTSSIMPSPAFDITITAVVDSWIEVRDAQGKKVFSGILKQGDAFPVPGSGMSLTTGNAGGIRLAVQGKDIPVLGARGKVIKNIALDPQTLFERGGKIPLRQDTE